MGKPNNNYKQKNSNYEEEESEIIEEDNIDNSDYNYKSEPTGERNLDKPTLDKLFDAKLHLKILEKQFKGFIEKDGAWEKVSPEIARDKFIDNMINGLRAIINEHNIYTYLSEEDGETILLEENVKFIKTILQEPTIDNPSDLRLMVEIYDHALQTFMGLIIKGHGSVVLRDVSGGLSQGNEHLKPSEKDSFFSSLGGMFSFGGKK